jgi:hypothetical protein
VTYLSLAEKAGDVHKLGRLVHPCPALHGIMTLAVGSVTFVSIKNDFESII